VFSVIINVIFVLILYTLFKFLMKLILFSFFILLLSINQTNGQVGGENIYEFLNISTSARQVALGGEVLTLIDDVNQAIWNPATINNDLNGLISVNYTSYLAGINIGSLSFAKMVSRKFGTLHAGIKYIDYGSLIGADIQGNETGSFNASDIALSLGYSYNIPWTNFYFGTNLRVINSSISNFSSFGISTDLAILYSSPFKPFSITLVARNIGTQITTFDAVREQLPFKISLGGSYQLDHVPLRWYFTLDNLQKWNLSVPNPSEQTIDLNGNITEKEVSFASNAFRHVVIGGEFFPENAFNLRFGYNFKRAAELKLQNVRTFSGISFGFGLKMNRIKFNYAYSKFHSAANSSTFSLLIDLNKNE